MSSRAIVAALVAVSVALGGCGQQVTNDASQAHATAAARTPDWSGGLWVKDEDPTTGDIGTMRGDSLPLTPEWRRKSDELNAIRARGGALPANESRCIPSGMPYMMITGGMEFLYSPGRIGIVVPTRGMQIRNILLDKKEHTADEFLLDSYSGESIGHWDGDTLVVDTIGVRSSNEMIYALKGTKMHITERFRQTAPGKLEIVTTIEDPKALAKPWTYVNTYTQHPEQFGTDGHYCVAAYDRTVDARTGAQGFDLTPPPEEGVGVPQSRVQN